MGSVLLHPEARYDLLQYFAMQYFPRKLHVCEGKNVFLYTIIGHLYLKCNCLHRSIFHVELRASANNSVYFVGEAPCNNNPICVILFHLLYISVKQ